MNFKKILSLIISTSLTLNTAFATTNIENKTNDKVKHSEKKEFIIKSINDKIIKFIKNHPALTSVAGTVTAYVCLKDLFNALRYDCILENYESNYREKFGNTIEDNKITPRQEGASWCAIACLAGLLYDKGYKTVTQKEIYKKTYKSWIGAPIFECNRTKGSLSFAPLTKQQLTDCEEYDKNLNTGYLIANILGFIYQSQFDEYVKNISNNKLRYQLLYVPYNTKDDDIIEAIKNILSKYKKISIIDGYVSSISEGDEQHFVNIVNISNNIITVEDPQIGLSRKENIKDFVQGYTNFKNSKYNILNKSPILSKVIPGIMIGVLTENTNFYNNNEIKNVFYFDTNNCKNTFEELKKVYQT